MIGALIKLPIFVLLVALVLWVGWFALGPSGGAAFLRERERLSRAYPDPEILESRCRWADARGTWLEGRFPPGPAAVRASLGEGLRAALLNLKVTLDILPVAMHLAMVGVLVGALLRERLRSPGGAYASPTLSYVGRILVQVGSLFIFAFALTPFALPFGWVYAAAGMVAFGGSLYAANLPLRL